MQKIQKDNNLANMKNTEKAKQSQFNIVLRGHECNTIEEMCEHFDTKEILKLRHNGSLATWLDSIGTDKANEIKLKIESLTTDNSKEVLTQILLCVYDNANAIFDAWYDCHDQEQSIDLLIIAAEQGDAEAQCKLSLCYIGGEGVKQDYAEALMWIKKAADQGYDAAQYALGRYYLCGIGVELDYAEAFKWFEKAAVNGAPDLNIKPMARP